MDRTVMSLLVAMIVLSAALGACTDVGNGNVSHFQVSADIDRLAELLGPMRLRISVTPTFDCDTIALTVVDVESITHVKQLRFVSSSAKNQAASFDFELFLSDAEHSALNLRIDGGGFSEPVKCYWSRSADTDSSASSACFLEYEGSTNAVYVRSKGGEPYQTLNARPELGSPIPWYEYRSIKTDQNSGSVKLSMAVEVWNHINEIELKYLGDSSIVPGGYQYIVSPAVPGDTVEFPLDIAVSKYGTYCIQFVVVMKSDREGWWSREWVETDESGHEDTIKQAPHIGDEAFPIGMLWFTRTADSVDVSTRRPDVSRRYMRDR